MTPKQLTVYRLHFTGPLHISNAREDYGISLKSISSDTMYAALTATLAKMGESVPEGGDFGCVISSLFPYQHCADGGAPTYYFPKPQSVRYERLKPEEFKAAKRMEWLEKSQFEKALNGQEVGLCENPDFVRSEVSVRATISRDYSEDTRSFFVDRLYFSDDSGLFFLAEGDTALLDTALPLLALEGIGTDRNVGNGFFEYAKDTLTLSVPDGADYGISLSVFVPKDKQQLEQFLSAEKGSYDIVRRGGWITTQYNSLRKNAIYAFAAGSVLYGLQSGEGRIVDLAPAGLVQHPVWRCGKALVLPIKA